MFISDLLSGWDARVPHYPARIPRSRAPLTPQLRHLIQRLPHLATLPFPLATPLDNTHINRKSQIANLNQIEIPLTIAIADSVT